jgi:hypothetical protein
LSCLPSVKIVVDGAVVEQYPDGGRELRGVKTGARFVNEYGAWLRMIRDVFAEINAKFTKFGVRLWGLAMFVLIAAFSLQRICPKLLQGANLVRV